MNAAFVVVPVMVSSLVVVFAVVELLLLPFVAQTFLWKEPLVAGAWWTSEGNRPRTKQYVLKAQSGNELRSRLGWEEILHHGKIGRPDDAQPRWARRHIRLLPH